MKERQKANIRVFLHRAQMAVDSAILLCPTGNFRNKLTDVNMDLMTLRDELEQERIEEEKK